MSVEEKYKDAKVPNKALLSILKGAFGYYLDNYL